MYMFVYMYTCVCLHTYVLYVHTRDVLIIGLAILAANMPISSYQVTTYRLYKNNTHQEICCW